MPSLFFWRVVAYLGWLSLALEAFHYHDTVSTVLAVLALVLMGWTEYRERAEQRELAAILDQVLQERQQEAKRARKYIDEGRGRDA